MRRNEKHLDELILKAFAINFCREVTPSPLGAGALVVFAVAGGRVSAESVSVQLDTGAGAEVVFAVAGGGGGGSTSDSDSDSDSVSVGTGGGALVGGALLGMLGETTVVSPSVLIGST